MARIAQVHITGKHFFRRLKNLPPGVRQERKVDIVGALDEETGMTRFIRATDSSALLTDLPEMKIAEAKAAFDRAEMALSLDTARKHGASHPTVDIDALTEKRGGNPEYRVPKPDKSFMLGKQPAKIPKKPR